ncbi:hypothetical protein [Brucella pseudintermedia]|uniref:hypothetical protein n=1 Tax=Brucella pseudintermedia TaxID=370111 RepID=UPI0030F444F7
MCETKNAIITDAILSTADHGVLSAWVHLNYGGSGQGFGGYVLCQHPTSPHYPGAGNYGGVFIRRVMDVVGVEKWSELKGKACRVIASHSGVAQIGNIIKDEWFDPQKEFLLLEGGEAAA